MPKTRKIIQEPTGRQKIAVVGMMPGKDELAAGKPFVGYEGKYLRRLMKRAGIDMSVLPVTNAAHERGAYDKWENLSQDAKKFGQEELLKDLERWKAAGVNLVIALGAPALKATTGAEGILKYRGTCLPCLVDGLKVLPSIHPGHIVKGNPRYEPVLTLDLRKAVREKDSPEIHYPFRDITIIDSPEEAIQIAELCTNSRTPIVVDIETNYPHTQEMTAYGIATSKRQAYVFTRELMRNPDVLRAIGRMASSKTLKIFHNALFDAFHGAYYYKICYRNIYCTLIAQHDCYPLWPKSLAFCASVWTNEPYWKDDSETALSTPGKVDWDMFYRYCGKDLSLIHI